MGLRDALAAHAATLKGTAVKVATDEGGKKTGATYGVVGLIAPEGLYLDLGKAVAGFVAWDDIVEITTDLEGPIFHTMLGGA